MKNMFRSLVFVLLVGGWTLAAAALHVIRVPGNFAVFTKSQLGFHDTYVDARTWTLADFQAHPAVYARLVQLGKASLLSNTVNNTGQSAEAQLANAGEHPTSGIPAMADKLKAEVKSGIDQIKGK